MPATKNKKVSPPKRGKRPSPAKSTKQNEEKAKYETQDAVIKELCKDVKVDIPSGMIEMEIDNMIKDIEQRLSYQGLKLEQYLQMMGKTMEDIRKEYEPQAIEGIKSRLALEAVIKAEKIELSNALTEETIQDLNKVTKKIAIKIGNETKTEKNDEGTEVTYTKGTIVIDDNSETKYTYNMVPVKAGTDEEKLADLANKMNNLTDKNIFEKLSVYSQFKKLYEKLIPAEGWKDVESKTIKQPQESKKGDKYLVWLKADNTIDLQIMTSSEEYKENEKTENVIVKEVTKMPVTGESLVLYIVAGVLLVLIVTIVILKVKNKNSDKNE